MAARRDLRHNTTGARALRSLRRGEPLTTGQLAQRLRVRSRALRSALRRLEERGLVRSERDGRERRWLANDSEE